MAMESRHRSIYLQMKRDFFYLFPFHFFIYFFFIFLNNDRVTMTDILSIFDKKSNHCATEMKSTPGTLARARPPCCFFSLLIFPPKRAEPLMSFLSL